MKETIILSAIKTAHNNVSVALQPVSRHCNIINHLASSGFPKPIKGKQGFLTSTGRFVDRKEAFKIASDALQLKETPSRDYLLSEDLW